MKHEEGVCPKCGGKNLNYDGLIQDGTCVGYIWICPDCSAEGVEWYNLEFSEHEIKYEGEKK